MKSCVGCQKLFPLTDFGKQGTSKYYNSRCRDCLRVQKTEYKRARASNMAPPPSGTVRDCQACGKTLPATGDFFHKSSSGKWGLAARCKPCEVRRGVEKNRRPHARAQSRKYMAKKWREDADYRARQNAGRGSRGHERRARQAEAPGDFTAQDLANQYATQNGKCYWCEQPVDFDKKSIDHYIPLVKGGSNYPDNIVIACRFCNTSKGAKMPREFMAYREEMRGIN